MNILFYNFIEDGNSGGESTHINEVLNGLTKIGHKIVSLDRCNSKNKRKIAVYKRSSVRTRTPFYLSELKIFKPIVGEFSILWNFILEIRIFSVALVKLIRRRKDIDLIYRRHGLYDSDYLLAKLTARKRA